MEVLTCSSMSIHCEAKQVKQPSVDANIDDQPFLSRAAVTAAWVVALGGFMANMDSSIVAIGLDVMRVHLRVDLTEIQWVATAYLLGLSAVLPSTPWLTRRLGAGRLWLSALVGFILTSVGCALAPTAALLIAMRGAQGMAAGTLITAGQTVIGLAVGPRRLGRMIGTLGLVVGLAPIIGPSVGGFLLARWSWPVLFWLNVPIGALVMLLGVRLVPRGIRSQQSALDWRGLSLVSVGLPVLVYALTELGMSRGQDRPLYLVLSALGLCALVTFGWWSLRARSPLLRLRLAIRPVMASGLSSLLFAGASLFGAVLLFPLWFQIQVGIGSTSTGLLLVSSGLGTAATVPIAGRLADRYGGGTVSFVGSLVVLASTIPWVLLDFHTSVILVQALLFVRSSGLGLSIVPAMTAAYASASSDDIGDATALANIVMRVGGAIGGALCVIVLSQGLDGGPGQGFHAAFGALGVICLLAAGASGWLCYAEYRQRRMN